jgi:predicted Zn-dependent peptidase
MSFETHTYDNGFRLIYEKAPLDTEQISINVFCDIGSIHEPNETLKDPEDRRVQSNARTSGASVASSTLKGSAHFIEHMCFKGTKKLKDTRTLSLIFDKTGAFLNAYTDRRYTCYYASGLSEHMCDYINTIGDMLLNSVFDKTQYDKEHDVVREEMTKDADDAETTVLENADRLLYAGSTFANPVDLLKYHEGPHSLKHEDVLAFYNQYYVPSRFILSICSANSFSEIKRCVDASPFARSKKMPATPIPPLILGVTPQTGVQYCIAKQSGISPAHICIGFRTCSISNPDRYCLKVLKNILSETMNARLFFLLREDNGLSYTSNAMCDYFEHMGDFKIYAECDNSKVFYNGSVTHGAKGIKGNKALGVFPLLIGLIEDLVKNGIKQDELTMAKNYLKNKMRMKSEDYDALAKHNGKLALFGLAHIPFSDVYKKCIEPITKKEMDSCIKKYFRHDGMTVSIISSDPDVAKQESYEKIVNAIKFI